MTSPTSASDGGAAQAEVTREHLRVLGLALLEVVTGDAQPAPAESERLYAWLKQTLAATPAEDGWQLAAPDPGPALRVRQLDADGTRFALAGDGIAGLLAALRQARAAMFDSEVPIRLRAPLPLVQELEATLEEAAPQR